MTSTVTIEDDVRAQARRAYDAFNGRVLPWAGPVARAMTGNPKLKVKISPTGVPSTDGSTIYLRVDHRLGEYIPHQKDRCGDYGPNGRQECEACALFEEILIECMHEVAHITENSFDNILPSEVEELVDRAVADLSGPKAAAIRNRVEKMRSATRLTNFWEATHALSPYLKTVLNALEDARINAAMYKARPGTHRMFHSHMVGVFEDGIVRPDGKVEHWKDQPIDAQVMIGLFVKASGYTMDPEWFSEEAIKVLSDRKLDKMLKEIVGLRSVRQVFRKSLPVLDRIQELGYCKRHEEKEEDQQEAEPAEDETDGKSESSEDNEPQESSGTDLEQEDDSYDEDDDDAEDFGDEDDDDFGDDDSDDGDDAVSDDDDGEGADAADDDDSDDDGHGDGEESDDSGTTDDTDDKSTSSDGTGSESLEDQDDADGEDGADDESGDDDGEASDSETDADGEQGSDDGDEDGDGESADDFNDGGTESSHGDGDSTDGDGDDDSDTDDSEAGEDTHGDASDGASRGIGAESDGDDEPTMSPEEIDALRSRLGGHGGATNLTPEEQADLRNFLEEVQKLIEQGDFFDQPSTEIRGLNVHKMVRGHATRRGYEIGWQHSVPTFTKVDDSVVLPALNRARVVFSDNRKYRTEPHLKTGAINRSVLGRRAPVGDPRLFEKRSKPGKKDYFVVIGLDMSASAKAYDAGVDEYGTWMQRIEVMKRAVYVQAELLNRLGIKFAVYGHTGYYHDARNRDYALDVEIFEIKSAAESWGPEAKDRLGRVSAASANLDGHTIEFYRKRLQESHATDRILLYYTDGQMPAENYAEELEILQRELKIMQRSGIRFLGVGLNSNAPSKYGLKTVMIQDLKDIKLVVDALQSELQGAMVGRGMG